MSRLLSHLSFSEKIFHSTRYFRAAGHAMKLVGNLSNSLGKRTGLKGFKQMQYCTQQARKNDVTWCWVDTCCIDKRSSSERPIRIVLERIDVARTCCAK
jgi:hypothetical protein